MTREIGLMRSRMLEERRTDTSADALMDHTGISGGGVGGPSGGGAKVDTRMAVLLTILWVGVAGLVALLVMQWWLAA